MFRTLPSGRARETWKNRVGKIGEVHGVDDFSGARHADIGGMDDRTAYNTWNMGNGMLVITPEPDKVMDIAEQHGIEAKVAGTVRES